MTWPKVKLGDVCDIVENINSKRVSPNETFSYIDIAAVNRETKQIETSSTLRYVDAPSRARQSVKANDVLVSTVRPNFNAVAKVPSELDSAVASTGFTVLRAKQSLCESWLFHWVKAPSFVDDMTDKAAGASYPAVSDRIVKDSEIPLPPIAEQKRLAAILDRADELRRARRQSLRVLDELAQSLFLELFGDPVDNSKNWEMRAIDSLCVLVRGSSPRPKADPRYYDGPVPRLMVADLTRDGFRVIPRIDSLTEEGAKLSRPVDAGTIVMAVSGNVGLVSQLAINACIHDGFVGFTKLNTEIVNPIFFMLTLHHLKSTHENRKAGAIFQNLTTTDIKAMKIPLPPLSLQQQFAQQIEELEAIKMRTRASLLELDALFACLQARAFAGELSDGKA